jgi:RsiW-degrading membrane proteinase PrsW (M82 family)
MASLTSPSLQCAFQSPVFPLKSLGCHAKTTHMKHTVISQQASAVLGHLLYSGSLVAVSTKT